MGERSNGIFILLNQPGRKWLFSDKVSAIYPLEIRLTNDHKIEIDSNNEFQIYPSSIKNRGEEYHNGESRNEHYCYKL